MTEPIIINGVDVRECENFVNNYMYKNSCNKASYITKCEIGNNCHYKQLKRKEQECEKLKKENEILQQYRGSKQASYEAMQKLWNEAEYDRKKYKKCLDYIKDELETSSHCESEECGCDDDSECLKCTIKLILKKINEVENEKV